MNNFLTILLIFGVSFSAEPSVANSSEARSQDPVQENLGRIGDYGYPSNPQYDRAKGYLLQGKVKNAVSNTGNFITWDYHPAGFWGEYGYLPHVGFVAGVPGHEYSSAWSNPGDPSWVQDDNSLWYSTDAFDAWVDIDESLEFEFAGCKGTVDDNGEACSDLNENECNGGDCAFIDPVYGILVNGVYKTIVHGTVIDYGSGNKGHDDRGKIAEQKFSLTDMIAYNGEAAWFLDHELGRLYLYLDDSSLDPNFASSGIGLAFPWSIRPKFSARTEASGGFYFDLYEYGDDQEEWTSDDEYAYYGATFAESWFIRDGNPSVKTDWQATTDSRYDSHNLNNSAGDLFGNTEFTDPNDPDALLAHSVFKSTWPSKYSFDTGTFEEFWPGWWADEYYGESPDLWSSVGIYDCNGTRADEGCWKQLPGRHISDMDVYMEFDDRWAMVGNDVLDGEYVAAGYPMGLQVMSMAHSYGVAYAEDVMFVTVKVRNESGDYCAFEKDKNGIELPIKDSNDLVVCDDGMIMPDGTKINRGQGFDYKKLYLGFYMDADVLSTDATGGYSVHTNEDDFMKYIDCKISDEEYPNGCPVVNEDTLRISMAVIGDYDGRSNSAEGYSMKTDSDVGTDFGVVAVQLLDSPYATVPVDLDQDGFYDIYPGEKLKMTDWHWFDWYNRPGVKSGNQTSDNPAKNKELIQYQVIAGDNTNLTISEKARYFHSANPETDYDSDINPHFDSLEGLEQTSFFQQDPDGLDCVLEMSTGPFDLEVGEEVSFSFSIIFGQNIQDLLKNAYFAQIMYNSHYQGYTPPITPNVMAVTDHGKVELYWDDAAIASRDVITGYSDFEGYKIYRSMDGGVTWGDADDQILIENAEEGWQPLSMGCYQNPVEESSLDLGCGLFNDKNNCVYSNSSNFERRDSNFNSIDDCYWQYAQFDLSAAEDAAFCIYGKNENGSCIVTDNCDGACVRGVDVQGPDPQAPWFNLGYDTGLEMLLIDPNNPDSVYVCGSSNEFCCGVDGIDGGISVDNAPDCFEDGESLLSGDVNVYKYKFIDDSVMDGIEYTYSVVAYDRGVPEETIEYVVADDGTYVQQTTSIPDPAGWGEINPFRMLESPKGTTVHESNFVKAIPGYRPQSSASGVKVVPNPYIVNSGPFNEEFYKKRMRFTRLPAQCTITIFSISGEKVRELHHDDANDGNLWWDLRSYNNQEIAPGLYIYVVETPSGDKKVDKFAVVR